MNPFHKMLATVRRLETLPEKFLDAAGPKSVELAKIGFVYQADPYGKNWAPTKTGLKFDKRDGLQNALRVSSVKLRNLVVMDLDHIAYKYHQRGTIYLPARLMVPLRVRGLGWWGPEYHELCRQIWARLVKPT